MALSPTLQRTLALRNKQNAEVAPKIAANAKVRRAVEMQRTNHAIGCLYNMLVDQVGREELETHLNQTGHSLFVRVYSK